LFVNFILLKNTDFTELTDTAEIIFSGVGVFGFDRVQLFA